MTPHIIRWEYRNGRAVATCTVDGWKSNPTTSVLPTVQVAAHTGRTRP